VAVWTLAPRLLLVSAHIPSGAVATFGALAKDQIRRISKAFYHAAEVYFCRTFFLPDQWSRRGPHQMYRPTRRWIVGRMWFILFTQISRPSLL